MRTDVLMLLLTLWMAPAPSQAEESAQSYCAQAAELAKEGDTKTALEEARWCVEALEQQLQEQEQAYFSEQIDGWTRGEIQQNSGMGMTLTEMRYAKGDQRIDVTLTGNDGPMAAIGAMAQLGMMQSGPRVRLTRRHSGTLSQDGVLSVKLKDGRLVMFKPKDTPKEELIAFAKQFPLQQLDGG